MKSKPRLSLVNRLAEAVRNLTGHPGTDLPPVPESGLMGFVSELASEEEARRARALRPVQSELDRVHAAVSSGKRAPCAHLEWQKRTRIGYGGDRIRTLVCKTCSLERVYRRDE